MITVNREDPQVVSESGNIGFCLAVSEPHVYQNIPMSCNREVHVTSDLICDHKICEASSCEAVKSGYHETNGYRSKEQKCPYYDNHANANNQETSSNTTDNVNVITDLKVKHKIFPAHTDVSDAENGHQKMTSTFKERNLNDKEQIISKKEVNFDKAHLRLELKNMAGEREVQCKKDGLMLEYNVSDNDFNQVTEDVNKLEGSMQNLKECNTKVEIEVKCPTAVEIEDTNVQIVDSSCEQDLETRNRDISFVNDCEMDNCVRDQNEFEEIYKSKMRRKSKRIQHSTKREEKCLEKSGNSKLKTKDRKREIVDTVEMKYEDFNDNVMKSEDDDDFPDLNTCSLKKEISKPELAVNNIIWTLHRGKWWPSYVKCIYSRSKKVSVNFIGCEQSVGIKVNCKNIRPYQQGHIPLFVDQSPQGLLEAVELCNSFLNICKSRGDFLPYQFFHLPAEERDALMNPKESSNAESDVSSVSKKRKSGREETPTSNKKLFKENKKTDDMHSMSARDKRKLEIAIQARRKDNEKLLKYIRSEDCISHLWQIFKGEKTSKRHEMYQEQYSRKMLMWSGVGPFHLDEEDEQILEMIDFLHMELSSKEQDFVQAHDYAIRVWMPEAIKEALRVVKKVPENELENALDTGYRETRTEKKARRLDFSFM